MLQQQNTGDEKKVTAADSITSFSNITSLVNLANQGMGLLTSQVTELNDSFIKAEDTVAKLSLQFGGARNFAQSIRENILDATTGIKALGGDIGDVINIQQGAIKGLQTQTILTKDSYEDLYASGTLLNDGQKITAESAKQMTSNFVNAGYSIYNLSKEVTGIVNEAKKLGVVVSTVAAQLNTSINRLSLYNFENGVQGMAQMAAKAASLRIDMKSTLDFAEKLFNPEAAIEMAASFQRLGVQVTSLLDPYKLMDLARNDPKKLQEAIIEATKSLTYFDEKNQRMAILPGAQTTLRQLAKETGYNTEELAKMALNAGDLERKLKEIRFSPSVADEDTKNLIANMAQMKDNKYQITFDEIDTEGVARTVTKNVEDLTDKNIEQIKKVGEGGASAVQLQKSANSTLINIYNTLKSMQGVLPRTVASSPRVQSEITKIGKSLEPKAEEIRGALGIKERKTSTGSFTDVSQSKKALEVIGDEGIKSFVEILKNPTAANAQVQFQTLMGQILTKIKDLNNTQTNTASGNVTPQTITPPTTSNTPVNVTPQPLTLFRQQDFTQVNPNQPLTNVLGTQPPTTTTTEESIKTINLNINFKSDGSDMENILNKTSIKQEIVKIVADSIKESDVLRGVGKVTAKSGL